MNIFLTETDKQYLEKFQEMMHFDIHKGYFKDNKKSYVYKALQATISAAMQNEFKENIFYTPNNGNIKRIENEKTHGTFLTEGRKREDMKELYVFYIDIDLKDDNNNSFSDEEIKNKKIELMNNLHELWTDKILKPSIIVESRNGFHLYYVSTINVHLNRWNKLEDVIFHTYKQYIPCTDERVKKPGQLLRFPFSIHQKDKSQTPFLVRILYINKKYTLSELESSFFTNFDFSLLNVHKNSLNTKKSTSDNKCLSDSDIFSSSIMNAIKNLDVDFFKKNLLKNHINPIPISFETRDSAVIYHLCFQDMSKLFDIDNPAEFSSPFRNDKHPSCSIFRKDDNTFRFYDHASKNAIQGSILNIVQQVANISVNQAIEFLAEIYNVTMPQFNPNNFHIDITELDNIINYNKSTFSNYVFNDKLIILYSECLECWKDGCLQKTTVPFLKHRTMITSEFLFNKLQEKYLNNNPFKKPSAIDRYMLQLEALHVLTLKRGGRKIPKEYTFHKINENDLKKRCILLKSKCKSIKFMNRNIIDEINNEMLKDIFHIDTIE